VGTFYRDVLTPEQRTRLVENIAGHLKDAAAFIQKRVVSSASFPGPKRGEEGREPGFSCSAYT